MHPRELYLLSQNITEVELSEKQKKTVPELIVNNCYYDK